MVLKVAVPMDLVQGDVDEGYGRVADAFRANFIKRHEIGAACAAYRDGRKIVDLWGGYRDGYSKAPWDIDTIVPVASTTKGMAAMAVALAHTRGLIDFDAPVSSYWPEFAANGKLAITVRQLLSHQAGLCAIDQPFELEDLADLDRVAAVIADQAPAWDPGTRQGYHGISLGWYEGELIRRVDPQHRSLGRFFADEIAEPLGIEFYIGLPDNVGDQRLARFHAFKPPEMLLHLHEFPVKFVLGFLNPRSITYKTFGNPRILGFLDNYNRRDVLEVEIPAANGVGSARAIAGAYGEFATGGKRLGLAASTLAALSQAAAAPSGGREDVVLGIESLFSLGYVKPFPRFRFGTGEGLAYGTPGGGGSFGFADPDLGLGFAYVMNRTGFRLFDDPREIALRDALYRSMNATPQLPSV
ncbi:MAG: serine hydrolase domain-containing protein [Acidimicrobiia bacterium]